MRIRVAAGCGSNSRIETDEETDKVWGDGVGEIVDKMSIFARRSIARGALGFFKRRERG